MIREPTAATLAKYGISLDEWLLLLDTQGGVCAICKKAPPSGRLNIDHEITEGTEQMSTVYLCGGINGLSDADATDWREEAKRRLSKRYDILDPMRRDFRGKELQNVDEIVHGDMNDIDNSNIVLVNAIRPSWGTAMEVRQAWHAGRMVITVCPSPTPSPWLVYHSRMIFPTFEAAFNFLLEIATAG